MPFRLCRVMHNLKQPSRQKNRKNVDVKRCEQMNIVPKNAPASPALWASLQPKLWTSPTRWGHFQPLPDKHRYLASTPHIIHILGKNDVHRICPPCHPLPSCLIAPSEWEQGPGIWGLLPIRQPYIDAHKLQTWIAGQWKAGGKLSGKPSSIIGHVTISRS